MNSLPALDILLKSSTIQGKVTNSLNGNLIYNAEINIRKGWNNYEGPYCNQAVVMTNSVGRFVISAKNGNYTVEIKKDGYLVGYCNVVSVKNETSMYVTMPITPYLQSEAYRMVLTWNRGTRAVEPILYFSNGKGGTPMYLSYLLQIGCIDEEREARLYEAASNGNSLCEVTILLKSGQISGREYYGFNILKQGNEDMQSYNPVVKLYRGNTLVKTYTCPDELKENGKRWEVFYITSVGIVEDLLEIYSK